jgi:predicted Fe-Mo cluster-binding NifX family protein
MELIVACATDDGMHFTERHFGDALKYDIYRCDSKQCTKIDEVINTTEEELQHADPVKAKGIVSLLVEKHVNVGMTIVFGPNIKRVKKNFVPVFAGCSRIDEAINKLINHHEQVCEMWEQGENREHCRI